MQRVDHQDEGEQKHSTQVIKGSHNCPKLASDLTLSFLVAKGKKVSYEGGEHRRISASRGTQSSS